ncbi:hypothetical protein K438DRAFT_1934775 [Mycena galopus ATCC 62051]|nr:hypothetical protein K438DRAFT_1934775 [Mycena galopus ATCC 62051]
MAYYRTDPVLRKLMIYTINTELISTICTIVILVLGLALSSTFYNISKCYVNSMFALYVPSLMGSIGSGLFLANNFSVLVSMRESFRAQAQNVNFSLGSMPQFQSSSAAVAEPASVSNKYCSAHCGSCVLATPQVIGTANTVMSLDSMIFTVKPKVRRFRMYLRPVTKSGIPPRPWRAWDEGWIQESYRSREDMDQSVFSGGIQLSRGNSFSMPEFAEPHASTHGLSIQQRLAGRSGLRYLAQGDLSPGQKELAIHQSCRGFARLSAFVDGFRSCLDPKSRTGLLNSLLMRGLPLPIG